MQGRPPAERSWPSLIGGAEGLIAQVVAPGVTRLSERIVAPGERSFFYLVEGTETDCLIDGGWGFCDRLDGVRRIPDKPLIGIATHSHFDHIGMLHLAQSRCGHAAEAAIFCDPTPEATQALPYLAGLPVLVDGSAIEPDSIRQTACPLDRLIDEGDTIDLGDRRLRVLHTPGHSPGSLSLLDEVNGLLFVADTVHDGHIYDDIPGADRAALAMSHQRLAEVDFAIACPGHGAILERATTLARMAQYRRAGDKS